MYPQTYLRERNKFLSQPYELSFPTPTYSSALALTTRSQFLVLSKGSLYTPLSHQISVFFFTGLGAALLIGAAARALPLSEAAARVKA
jgi:hypothetical protein